MLLSFIFILPYRFSLPDGSLTTYDTYPEKALPDGRVSICVLSSSATASYPYICALLASWMVVRHSPGVARCHISKPRPPHAEDGSPSPPYAARHRQFSRCRGHLEEPSHGLSCGAQLGSGTAQRSDQSGSKKPAPA